MPTLRDVTDQEVPTAFIEAVRHPNSGRCLLCGYGPLIGTSCLGQCISKDCICCKTEGYSISPHEEPSREERSGLSDAQLDTLTTELLEEY